MMPNSFLPTLLHVFESGAAPWPAPDSRVLFLNTPAEADRLRQYPGILSPVQGFRPDFLTLQRAGLDVRPEPDGSDYDFALILLGRHRRQNEHWLAEALARTKEGGLIVVAGGKTDGIDSLRRRIAASPGIAGHLSKHHGVAFWLVNTGQALATDARSTLLENRFRVAPGMFSADGVDPASRLLADNLPGDLKGDVADFCSGWGYLAVEVAERCPGVTLLDLYEADYPSVEASRENLATVSRPGLQIGFQWRDLIGESLAAAYDAIVMNPPFHQGRAAEPGLGETLIARAASSLKRGGRLLMVANRGLPYEAALKKHFALSGELARDAGFKVLWGKR